MKKSVALILMVFLVVACSLAALVALSLLATGFESSMSFSQSVEALGLAVGGKEGYLEYLESDSDWSDQANITGIDLGRGTFDITINSASQNSISFTVTGKVPGAASQIVQRQVRLTAKRLPKACQFAVYWGNDSGALLHLRGTSVDGNFWSRGSAEVRADSSVNGFSFCPDNQSITGAGSFTERKIGLPYPDMLQIDEAPYNDAINNFDFLISANGGGSNRNQLQDLVLNGNTIGCRNFSTSGDITISGYGYIIASRNIRLHSRNQASGTLTITPQGGNIYFLAGRNIIVNSTKSDTNAIINSGTHLYSQAQGKNHRVIVRKHPATTTTIDSSVIIGKRRITVEDGAQVTNSILYVSDISDQNNYLRIRGVGTLVTGSIISVSSSNPGLIIDNNAQARGFIYHWGGTTQIDDVNIEGTVIASQFDKNRIRDCNITFDSGQLLSLPPGFPEGISAELTSWDDN